MFIKALGRQMAVCSFDGAKRLIAVDKNYWNAISIHGPRDLRAELPLAKAVYYACFDDVHEEDSVVYRSARAADLAGIFDFIRSLGSGPPAAPLLVHCQMGISRSTAVALSWVYGQLPSSKDRARRAIDVILELRPEAKPNRLVLFLGLSQYMPPPEARHLVSRIVSEPRLARNYAISPPG
jgi:predicted protein tyrosine phosphatase